MPRSKIPGSIRFTFLIISLSVWLAVSLRWVMEFMEQNHPLVAVLSAILLIYGVFLVVDPFVITEKPLLTHVYLILQTALVSVAMTLWFELDFFALLYIPLSGTATLTLQPPVSRRWVGILVLATFAGQWVQFGWPEALPFAFLYIAGIIFVAIFSENTLKSEQARKQSDALFEELRVAHQQLQEYTTQAGELAAAQERNRLARDLHDSVAQTLYGLTLRSEAALRKLNQGDLNSVEEYLKEFQQSTQQSLKETRLLIYELRPDTLVEEGLRAALIARLESVERRSGIQLELDIHEVGEIPTNIANAYYRIAQEVLNNTLKHGQAGKVKVTLTRTNEILRMAIQDDGVGFDTVPRRGGLGLQGMRERATEVGASLEIVSLPGNGVCITLEAAL